jgi:hypothetical protein
MKSLKEIALDTPKQTMLEAPVLHYTEVYDKFFAEIRQEKIRFLLIGIGEGGCLKAWKEYFPNVEIFAIDIRPECKEFEEEGIEIHIGDQGDPDFISSFLEETGGGFDIIIDDGGSQMYQQINSLLLLWNSVNPEGRYVIEDTHTSYWESFGGSIHGPNMKIQSQGQIQITTVDLLKSLIDNLHAIHTGRDTVWDDDYAEYIGLKNSDDPYIHARVIEPIDKISSTLESIHFYDSLALMIKV